jgi:uncharacterized protein
VKQYVKEISLKAEFSIVVLTAFGHFMLGSVLWIIAPAPSASAPISESGLQSVFVYETVVLLVLWKFLSLRGWTLQRLGLVLSIRDTLNGVGLAVVSYIAYAVVWLIALRFLPSLQEQANRLVAPGFDLATILVVSILNPVFEELFVCGYVVTALKKTRGLAFAVNASIAIRLTYHLYQEAVGVISIVSLGLIFTYWFARTGRLWPLVVAHGLFDFFALTMSGRS